MSYNDRYIWQTHNLHQYLESPTIGPKRKSSYLIYASPASGKTVGTGKISKALVEDNKIDFSIICVPSVELKFSYQRDWKKHLGIELTTSDLAGQNRPPSQYQGCVLTYHQLAKFLPTFAAWADADVRLFGNFDEFHHVAENNIWGAETEKLASHLAATPLADTGTPFRSNGTRMLRIEYDDEGRAIPDYTYSYREAVRDRICKPVTFYKEDGGIDLIDGSQLKISEATTEDQKKSIIKEILSGDSIHLNEMIQRCHDDLQQTRLHRDPAAGMLLIARPGWDDGNDDERHVRLLAAAASRVFGYTIPYVICDDDVDDENAIAKIARFRHSQDPAIASIGMLAEGVDIPRLTHLLLARPTTSELLFRQLVGRVIRVQNADDPGEAKVYMPALPELVAFASRMEEEANAGLRERAESDSPYRGTGMGGSDNSNSMQPIAIGSFHKPGGIVTSSGEEYPAEVMEQVRVIKSQDLDIAKLNDAIVAKILSKKSSVITVPSNSYDEDEPLEVKKAKKRSTIVEMVQALGQRLQKSQPKEDAGYWYRKLYFDLSRNVGAHNINDLMNNHPIAKADQAIEIVTKWIEDNNAV